MRLRSIPIVLLAALPLAVCAQAAEVLVSWTASVAPSSTASAREAVLTVAARIEPGWHVYALAQGGSGPTPLRVSIDANPLAESAGPITGDVPEKKFDRGFGFETQIYSNAFTLHMPLRLVSVKQPIAELPISIRYQSCSDRECRPPTTVHVAAEFEKQR